MTRGLGRRLAQTLKVACAAAIVVAAQACSQKSNELDPDDVDQVSQALAGDCGYDYNVCVIHTACESWGRDAQDDGLGYTTRAPWTETGPWYTMSCTDTYCDPPELDPCPNAQATRQDQLRAPIPSQPARDGLVVTLDEVKSKTEAEFRVALKNA